METPSTTSGINSVRTSDAQQADCLWRPWRGHARKTSQNPTCGDLSDAKHSKQPQVIHPVKLFWPKSRCFDYLYQDAEKLLRNYPVQATISLYKDSSSDEDSDDEEEEAVDKELN
ncbi:protein ripply2 [Gouania willdenowi]|uniref:protein ripply2 n=1 Tax=Gouania willdenowi TaxID=441366 RepID=UPI001056DAA8|nr:protein ripply2-like [Gouania willdenowi]